MNNADRKRQLIAQGRIYRAEVMHDAAQAIRTGHLGLGTRRPSPQALLPGAA